MARKNEVEVAAESAPVEPTELSPIMRAAHMMEDLLPVIHKLGTGVEKFKTTVPPKEAPAGLDKSIAALYPRMPQTLQAECLVLAGIWSTNEFTLPTELESAINQFNDCSDMMQELISRERQLVFRPKSTGIGVAVNTPATATTPKEKMMSLVGALHREFPLAARDYGVHVIEDDSGAKVCWTVNGKVHTGVHRSNIVGDYLKIRELELQNGIGSQ
jgi:hypothetical protein